MDSIFSSIKAPRELTFANWRYRLLHWTFGTNPATPADSPLPGFLYSHYCPLFHLTNALAVVLPVIVAWKIVKPLVLLLGIVVAWCVRPLAKWREAVAIEAAKREETIEFHFERMVTDPARTFDVFWGVYGRNRDPDNMSLWQSRWDKRRQQIAAAKAKAAAAAAIRRERMLFWVHVSGTLVKGALVVVLTIAVAFLVYGFVVEFLPWFFVTVVEGAKWFWTLLRGDVWGTVWSLLKFFASAALMLGAVIGLGSLLWKYKGADIGGPIKAGVEVVTAPPRAFVVWCFGCLAAVAEFFSMFYAENCPPITIHQPEDEPCSPSPE